MGICMVAKEIKRELLILAISLVELFAVTLHENVSLIKIKLNLNISPILLMWSLKSYKSILNIAPLPKLKFFYCHLIVPDNFLANAEIVQWHRECSTGF